MKTFLRPLAVLALLATAAHAAPPGKEDPVPGKPGYTNTPIIPGTPWRVHDAHRPRPPVVTSVAPALPVAPPSDAIVLFDGKDLSNFVGDSTNAIAWKVENGYVECAGKGGIKTKDEFGDIQLHVEFATPEKIEGESQGRGNSGIFLMGMYETQILDSWENPSYADGQLGGIYGQMPPMVNPARKPGEWQSYDILWTAPRFSPDGKLEKPAAITSFINGVCVQNHYELTGNTPHKQNGTYKPHKPTGPIGFQNHNNPMRLRNIWLRNLNAYENR